MFAAAVAKSLQSCPTLCDPIDGSPLGSSEKVGLKLNIQKTKIMASSPIISWEIDGETVAEFILGGSKIIADGDCRN